MRETWEIAMARRPARVLLFVLVSAVAVSLVGQAQTVVSSAPIGLVWQMERARLGVRAGQGIALSPNGKSVVYAGSRDAESVDASLLLVDLETGNRTVLWDAEERTLMASKPSFSADGNSIVFDIHGPTWSYPTDIYTVDAEGKRLRKLTESVPCTEKRADQPEPRGQNNCVYYQRYYYNPRYSPDGSRILVSVDDEVGARELTAVMRTDGGNLQVLAEGRPCCWSADGKAVYYTHKGLLTRMDLATRATRAVALPAVEKRVPLGRMTGRDWFAFKVGNGRIGWYDVGTGAHAPAFLGQWSVPGAKMAGRERLELKGFNWSDSNEVLLWYKGEDTERFEVVRIFDPTSRSR
jgi:hypothetical protein